MANKYNQVMTPQVRSTYVPLPIDAVSQAAKQYRQDYEQAKALEDELYQVYSNMEAAPFTNDQELAEQLRADTKAQLDKFAAAGNYEKLGTSVRNLARDFVSRYAPIQENLQLWTAAEAAVDALPNLTAAQREARKQYMKNSYAGLEYTDSGMIKSGSKFDPYAFQGGVNLADKVLQVIPGMDPEIMKYMDFEYIGDIDDPNYTGTPKFIVTSATETHKVDAERIQAALNSLAEADPTISAYFEDERMLGGYEFDTYQNILNDPNASEEDVLAAAQYMDGLVAEAGTDNPDELREFAANKVVSAQMNSANQFAQTLRANKTVTSKTLDYNKEWLNEQELAIYEDKLKLQAKYTPSEEDTPEYPNSAKGEAYPVFEDASYDYAADVNTAATLRTNLDATATALNTIKAQLYNDNWNTFYTEAEADYNAYYAQQSPEVQANLSTNKEAWIEAQAQSKMNNLYAAEIGQAENEFYSQWHRLSQIEARIDAAEQTVIGDNAEFRSVYDAAMNHFYKPPMMITDADLPFQLENASVLEQAGVIAFLRSDPNVYKVAMNTVNQMQGKPITFNDLFGPNAPLSMYSAQARQYKKQFSSYGAEFPTKTAELYNDVAFNGHLETAETIPWIPKANTILGTDTGKYSDLIQSNVQAMRDNPSVANGFAVYANDSGLFDPVGKTKAEQKQIQKIQDGLKDGSVEMVLLPLDRATSKGGGSGLFTVNFKTKDGKHIYDSPKVVYQMDGSGDTYMRELRNYVHANLSAADAVLFDRRLDSRYRQFPTAQDVQTMPVLYTTSMQDFKDNGVVSELTAPKDLRTGKLVGAIPVGYDYVDDEGNVNQIHIARMSFGNQESLVPVYIKEGRYYPVLNENGSFDRFFNADDLLVRFGA